jgi:hypothetical protein
MPASFQLRAKIPVVNLRKDQETQRGYFRDLFRAGVGAHNLSRRRKAGSSTLSLVGFGISDDTSAQFGTIPYRESFSLQWAINSSELAVIRARQTTKAFLITRPSISSGKPTTAAPCSFPLNIEFLQPRMG